MAINLNNFVDININYNTTRNANYTRDTAVLIINGPEEKDKTYDSVKSILEDFPHEDDNRFEEQQELRYYIEEFFNNNGNKLRIIEMETNPGNPKYIPVKTSSFEEMEYYKKDAEAASGYSVALPNNMEPPLYNYFVETTEGVITAEGYRSEAKFEEKTYYTITDTVAEDVDEDNFIYGTFYTRTGQNAPYVYTLATSFVEGTTYYTLKLTLITPEDVNLYQQVSTYAPININKLVEKIESLESTNIVICSNQSANTMKSVSVLINKPTEDGDNIKGVESKLILSCIDAESIKVVDIPSTLYTNTYNGFVLKYGVLGSEMAIAAYLTNINVFAANSVKDYDFTLEKIDYSYTTSGNEIVTVSGFLVDDDADAKSLMENNINFNGELVNEIRAIGGNDTNGNDFVNEFMLILLHQTLTEQLVNLLTTKIKYNSTGLSLIGATISRELQKYVNNGYLTTDKTWEDEDLVYNGITIITKNTPLKIGYKYVVMPFATLSDIERKQHKLPTIYILIADSYSIRKIEIEGTVF